MNFDPLKILEKLIDAIKEGNPWVIGLLGVVFTANILQALYFWYLGARKNRMDSFANLLKEDNLEDEVRAAIREAFQIAVFEQATNGLSASRQLRAAMHEAIVLSPHLTYQTMRAARSFLRVGREHKNLRVEIKASDNWFAAVELTLGLVAVGFGSLFLVVGLLLVVDGKIGAGFSNLFLSVVFTAFALVPLLQVHKFQSARSLRSTLSASHSVGVPIRGKHGPAIRGE